MPIFTYSAINKSGRQTIGTLEAAGAAEVAARLLRDGLYVQSVDLATGATRAGAARANRRRSLGDILFPGVGGKDITAFTRQMASFLQGGFPLIRALEFIERNAGKDSMRELVNQVAEEVRSGGTLARALAQHPKIFDKLYISMISAGEASGQLETMYERLATMRESADELRSEIKGALTYPGFMMLAMGGSLAILMTFVVPKFAAMFEDMGSTLPAPTLFLLSVSGVFHHYWWLILAAIAGGFIGIKQYGKTETGALELDRLLLKVPIMGELALKSATARFSQTLATLLESGVDLITALECVQNVTGNEVMGKAITDSIEQVKQGDKLSDTMEGTGAFPEELVEMIRVGEESGQVGPMLSRAAITYNREVRSTVSSFTKILEPLMILVMGAVIGLIVMAMLMPVFEMSTGAH